MYISNSCHKKRTLVFPNDQSADGVRKIRVVEEIWSGGEFLKRLWFYFLKESVKILILDCLFLNIVLYIYISEINPELNHWHAIQFSLRYSFFYCNCGDHRSSSTSYIYIHLSIKWHVNLSIFFVVVVASFVF